MEASFKTKLDEHFHFIREAILLENLVKLFHKFEYTGSGKKPPVLDQAIARVVVVVMMWGGGGLLFDSGGRAIFSVCLGLVR